MSGDVISGRNEVSLTKPLYRGVDAQACLNQAFKGVNAFCERCGGCTPKSRHIVVHPSVLFETGFVKAINAFNSAGAVEAGNRFCQEDSI